MEGRKKRETEREKYEKRKMGDRSRETRSIPR